jgi:hypothetical protein
VHGHIHVVPTDLRVGGAQCPLRHCPIRDVGGLLHCPIKVLQGGGRAVPHGLGAPTALLATLKIQPRTQEEADRRCKAQQPCNAPERASCNVRPLTFLLEEVFLALAISYQTMP